MQYHTLFYQYYDIKLHFWSGAWIMSYYDVTQVLLFMVFKAASKQIFL